MRSSAQESVDHRQAIASSSTYSTPGSLRTYDLQIKQKHNFFEVYDVNYFKHVSETIIMLYFKE